MTKRVPVENWIGILVFVAGALALLAPGNAFAINLLQNGDFELPAGGGGMYLPTYWTGNDPNRTLMQGTDGIGSSGDVSLKGFNGSGIPQTDWIAQNTGVQMQAGITYTLSVYTMCGSQTDVGDIIITANNTTETVDDYDVAHKNFYTWSGSDWVWGSTPNTVQYTCTAQYAGKYIGVWLDTQTGSGWVTWDNASLVASAPSCTVNVNAAATGRPIEPRILGQANQSWETTHDDTLEHIQMDFDYAWCSDNHRASDLKVNFMRQGFDDAGHGVLGASELLLDTVQQRMTQMNVSNVIVTGPVISDPENPSFDYTAWYTARVNRMLNNVATHGYVKIKYWEIGNEPGPSGSFTYAVWKTRYLAAYNAIKAIDPTLKVGPNFGRCNQPLDPALGNQSWFRYTLQDLQVPMDFISYHPYHTTPVNGDNWDISHTLTYLSQMPHDSADSPGGRALVDQYRPGSGIEVFGTEYGGTVSGFDCQRLGFGFSLVRQLTMAHGKFGIEPLDGANYFLFFTKGVSSPADQRGPYGITEMWYGEDNPPLLPGAKLRPGYYTLKLLAQAWVGKELGLLDPEASSSGKTGNGVTLGVGTLPDTLQVFVTRNEATNTLNLLVTNTDPAGSVGANFNLSNFGTITSAHAWKIDGTNLDPSANFSTMFSVIEPGPDSLIQDLGEITPVPGSNFSWGFGPHSMTLITLNNSPVNPGVLNVTPLSRSVDGTAGTTTFAVSNTGGGTMPWTASVTAGQSWLSVTSGSSGTNSGTITATFTANSGAQRAGTIHVDAGAAGTQDVTVTQAAGQTQGATVHGTVTYTNYTGYPLNTVTIEIRSGATVVETHPTLALTGSIGSKTYTFTPTLTGGPYTLAIVKNAQTGWKETTQSNVTIAGDTTVNFTVTHAISGDASMDNKVDVSDLGILAANYGGTGKNWSLGDFNGDGKVDVSDLGILAANYGSGSGATLDFNADAAKLGLAAGDNQSVSKEGTPVTSTLGCGSAGLPLIAGLLLMVVGLVKLDE